MGHGSREAAEGAVISLLSFYLSVHEVAGTYQTRETAALTKKGKQDHRYTMLLPTDGGCGLSSPFSSILSFADHEGAHSDPHPIRRACLTRDARGTPPTTLACPSTSLPSVGLGVSWASVERMIT
ncbi:hypothetical protein BD310DRAFT_240677 [Dichomitus squalens]|uniref:Uncharacterized protein n=1 Tax=Dichomitus squalens TaxID=114155 RepID=A0A4Q9Q2D5_9APHY|nr:hypothetical protein BD310DRAFT_240677 [Dichomitus squalens]